jgi:hypothetical protein
VVAIFLRGSTYELKQFNEQNPNVLFKKYSLYLCSIRGYHLKFEEEKVKDLIK